MYADKLLPQATGGRMSLLIGFIIAFVILGAGAKILSAPPEVYADMDTEQKDHGHH
jgi:hypothetical protein